MYKVVILLLLFKILVMFDSLWPRGMQHIRLPCPSPSARAFSNSCPLSQWCHSTISSSVVPFSWLQYFPASMSFLHIRWPKYWTFSFSISPSNEYAWFYILVCVSIYIYIYICVCVCVCRYIYVSIYIYVYIYICKMIISCVK